VHLYKRAGKPRDGSPVKKKFFPDAMPRAGSLMLFSLKQGAMQAGIDKRGFHPKDESPNKPAMGFTMPNI